MCNRSALSRTFYPQTLHYIALLCSTLHMPQTTATTPGARCRTCSTTATTVVEYRVPDPRSAHDETFPPAYLLTCDQPRCVDLAEDEAVYQGAPERLVDVRPLDRREAAILAEVA